jgi:hypothetical protein
MSAFRDRQAPETGAGCLSTSQFGPHLSRFAPQQPSFTKFWHPRPRV